MGEGTVGVMITGIAASLVLTPALAALGNKLARALRQRFETPVPNSENLPKASTAPVVVFGMGEVGRTVVDALKANSVSYEAIEMDYDRFLAASADGYPVAFGEPGDVRLMETLAFGLRPWLPPTEHSEHRFRFPEPRMLSRSNPYDGLARMRPV